jgi:4'-phosphopantetheinyl transferase
LTTSRATRLAALESEVHVWLARPDAARCADCIALLDAGERARYRRFRFPDDRYLFLVAHALLRRALSRYVDVEPSAWRFGRRAHGRPEIVAPYLPVRLRFNLSHTAGLAACVVTLENDCGIDVEGVAERRNMPGIADRMFAGPEQRDLRARAGEADYTERFITYWTLREAWCKALGTGLAHTDRRVWFEPLGGSDVRIHGTHGPGEGAGRWQCVMLQPTATHRLAVVTARTSAADMPVVCRFIEP